MYDYGKICGAGHGIPCAAYLPTRFTVRQASGYFFGAGQPAHERTSFPNLIPFRHGPQALASPAARPRSGRRRTDSIGDRDRVAGRPR